MERWRRSKTKILKYGESIDVFIEKVNDGQEIDFDYLWNVKLFIFYHHESKDFHSDFPRNRKEIVIVDTLKRPRLQKILLR